MITRSHLFHNKPTVIFFFIVLIAFSSIFYAERHAVQKELQFKPLANGWVSFYPDVIIDDKLTVYGKVKKIVSADLQHGRFRPAFSPYASSGYLLSPIFHDRLGELGAKRYGELITGDLRIFTQILIISVILSILMVTILVYRFTGTYIFSLIPIFFIPLSSSLTENLLQNYIDSQEIPLTLWLSMWLLFYHLVLTTKHVRGKTYFTFALSILSLVLVYLTKETSIIIFGLLCFHLLIALIFKKFRLQNIGNIYLKFIIVTTILSGFLTFLVLYITMMNKTGYATAYMFDVSKVQSAIDKLWLCLNSYSIVNIYTVTFIFFTFLLLIFKNNIKINGISALNHILLLSSFSIITLGLSLILIPWDPILTKYTFPCLLMFSFLFSYSISISYSIIRANNPKLSIVFAATVLLISSYHYMKIVDSAESTRNYYINQANYGVSVIPLISGSIGRDLESYKDRDYKVLIQYQAGKKWKNNVTWSKLHLQRWLNIDGEYNILSKSGRVIYHYSMPKGETTSFKYDGGKKGVYVSEKISEINSLDFDVIYRAYLKDEIAEETIISDTRNYSITEERIVYPRYPYLQSFTVYKYLPATSVVP